ncbi:MAG: hypothetical protein JXQ29_16900 [Planctomycetes bacterium]|nr:hypothetical protein [Planctomycetota bacterium]
MTAAVRRLRRALVLALLGLAAGGAAWAQAAPDPLEELRAEADRTLALRNAELRGRLGIVLRYAERLRQTGDRKGARQYVDRVLKLDSWAMDAHLMVAEMTREEGDAAATEKKANWLLEHAESDGVRTGALHLLERTADTAIPDIERVPGESVKIVLIPIGAVDVLLLKAAAEQVMRRLNYEVVLQRAGLELPRDAETPLRAYLDDLRKRFVPLLDTPEGDAALAATSRGRAQLEAEEVFLLVVRTWLEQQARWRELADLEARLETDYRPRWSADTMLRHFASVLGPHGRPNVMYVGVTRADMHADARRRSGPVFGWGGREVAVMTYGPFLSARSGEKPSWERLVARTTKQIICTAGSAFEIGRCGNAKCPMRVVYDLRSLDQKGYDPCTRCAEQLRRRY